MIYLAAFLEGNGPRLAIWEAQKYSVAAEGQCIQEILSVNKTVDLLKETRTEISKDLVALNEERTQLLAQLKTIEDAIKQKEDALS
jgi:hypothetical protein